MIQHVAAFTWKPGTPDGHADAVTAALHDLVRHIPEVRDYRCGSNLGISPAANADYVVAASFDDEAGWAAYDRHPMHHEVRERLFVPWVASRTSAQFRFDG
ncbi:MAG: Dabb family protein [Acidobacteria bacterium]|nr:Dabb family protein [Acidobacteriota bacterium]